MWRLGSHIGTSVSALVDGQLSPDVAERAWSHVLGCRHCRRLVGQEGRVKTELATLAGSEPSARLLGSLYCIDGPELDAPDHVRSADWWNAWAAVDEMERKGSGRRRAGLAIVGAGSAAAVLGFASLSGATLGIGGGPPSTPPTSLSRPTPSPSPTTALIAPVVSVEGRIPATRH